MFNCYECLLLYLKGFKQVFKLNTLGCRPNLNYLLSSVTDQGTTTFHKMQPDMSIQKV